MLNYVKICSSYILNYALTNIENSIDAVHTEVQMLTPNKMVENTRSIEIDFIRDPFLIEQTRVDNIQSKVNTVYLDIPPILACNMQHVTTNSIRTCTSRVHN